MSLIPKWLQMQPGTKERLRTWLAWRLEGHTESFDYDALERDGGYDLYRYASKVDSKRRKMFRDCYGSLNTCQLPPAKARGIPPRNLVDFGG